MGAGKHKLNVGLVDWVLSAFEKKLVADVLVAGAVMYGVVRVYDIVSYYVGFANNAVVTYCVMGYLVAKLYAYLRNG